jgi:hypothetical protein
LVQPDSIVILTIVVHRRHNLTNNGVPAASPCPPPPCDPPPPCRRVLSALSISIAHGTVMDRHAAWTSSRSDASSAAPVPLLGGGPIVPAPPS